MVSRTVAFFSNREELLSLTERADFTQLRLVALTPAADFAAEQQQLEFRTIEDYCDEPQLNIDGTQALTTIAALCTAIDQQFFKDSVYSAFHHFHFLKTAHDQLRISVMAITAILVEEQPTQFLIGHIPELDYCLVGSDNQDIFPQTLWLLAQKNNIPCIRFCPPNPNGGKATSPSLQERCSTLKFSLENFFYNSCKSKNTPAIFLAQHWDFETCKALRKFYKMYWLRQLSPHFPALEKTLSSPQAETFKAAYRVWQPYFSINGVDVSQMMVPRMQHLLQLEVYFSRMIEMYTDFYRKRSIEMVIGAAGQSHAITAAISAAHRLGLPTIWGQHGGFYGYGDFPLVPYISHDYSDYFLYTAPTSQLNPMKPHYVVSDSKLLKLYRGVHGTN